MTGARIKNLCIGIIPVALLGLGMFLSQLNAAEPEQVVEVLANKLNLRAGEGTNYPILKTLNKTDKLVVVKEKSEWLEVRLPDDVSCWVSKKYVEVKDKDKGMGVIKGATKMNVRSKPETGDNVIGNVNEGQAVQIKTEKGEWYQIAPTETLTGWVNKKYTKYWGTYARYQAEKDKIKQAELDRKDLQEQFSKAEEMYKLEQQKPYQQQNYGEILGLYRAIINKSVDKELIDKCDARVKQIEPVENVLQELRNAIATKDKRIKEIEEDAIAKLKALFASQVQQPAYTAQGWVEGEGKYIGRPAAHILTVGGVTKYYLKSATINLDDYFGQLVGVKGNIVANKDGQVKTIMVDKIEILAVEGDQ